MTGFCITNTYRRVAVAFAAGCLFASTRLLAVSEVTLSANVLPPAALPDGGSGISPGGSGITNDPYVYSFVTTNGMAMAGYTVYGGGASNKCVLLNLNGGSISGTQSSNAFDFSAAGAVASFASSLTISNAVNIKIGKILTYQSTFQAAGVSGHNGGTVNLGSSNSPANRVEVGEISTYAYVSQSAGATAGDITINGTNDVLIWNGSAAGDLNASHPGGGNAEEGKAGSVTVLHDGAFLANDVMSYLDLKGMYSGSKSILLDGNMKGDAVSGSFSARRLDSHGYSQRGTCGSITVKGYTDVSVSDGVYSYQKYDLDRQFFTAGAIIITNVSGNILIGAGGLNAYHAGGFGNGDGGSVSLSSTGGNITVRGDIKTYSTHGVDTNPRGGNVILSSAGSITMSGGFDLRGISSSYNGSLTLNATNAIYLNGLDLASVGQVAVNCGTMCVATGAVSNFATNYSTGSGIPVAPYITTQTSLRMPANKRLSYRTDVAGNSYLNGKSFKLADLAGTAGAGGLLTPRTAPGTVVSLR